MSKFPDGIPNRMSADKDSQYFHENYTDVEVWLSGIKLRDVIEYNIKESWVKIYRRRANGKLVVAGDRVLTCYRLGFVAVREVAAV
jgi:hypothetical protein